MHAEGFRAVRASIENLEENPVQHTQAHRTFRRFRGRAAAERYHQRFHFLGQLREINHNPLSSGGLHSFVAQDSILVTGLVKIDQRVRGGHQLILAQKQRGGIQQGALPVFELPAYVYPQF